MRSAPLPPLSVPPAIAVAPLPVTNRPPDDRVSVPSSVTVEAAVNRKELILVPSPTLAVVLAFNVTLLSAPQLAGIQLGLVTRRHRAVRSGKVRCRPPPPNRFRCT